ncbi:unnamed protein product [Boreogadus saida]
MVVSWGIVSGWAGLVPHALAREVTPVGDAIPVVFTIALIRVTLWMLSGSGCWISAVYAIYHLSLGPPGLRVLGRVTTLLHRWLKPRVVSECPETGISAG